MYNDDGILEKKIKGKFFLVYRNALLFDSAFFGFGTLLCVVMIITMLSGFDWDFKTKITLFPLSIACTVLFILDLLTLIKLKTCNFHMKRVKLK